MDTNNPPQDPDVNLDVLNLNQDIFSCNYYSVDSFKSLTQQFHENGLSVICFNIRSFNRNGDEFLGYLYNCEHVFDIIILTETWAKDETHTFCNIPGYNSTHNSRENRRGGGVSIYLKESIDFSVIETINISENFIEAIAVTFQSEQSGQKVNVLGIYRPPNGDAELFTASMSDILHGHNLSANETIIAGDFNICLLNEYSTVTRNFTNMMNGYFFRPVITRPTRFKENTATVIDHIWVNNVHDVNSGIFYCDITDHCPVFCRINTLTKTKDKLVKIKFRNLSLSNKLRFNELVRNTDWNQLLHGINNTNDMVLTLINTLEKY